ncbi:expressed protein [Phakopsora pachyrhizi]|uniref:Pre-rRNA-processing protein RIX1 n=1 Tax=Phakopsora pachyrhizi TaxID=170000 RepID=A0AAV0BLZ3_PHAPC|nr:expressed protein [Phakopsora pachyrhizi]
MENLNSTVGSSLGFILSVYLSSDQVAIQSSHLVISIVSQLQPIRIAVSNTDDKTSVSTLKRWFIRLNSLINSRDSKVNSLGARLAIRSFQQHSEILLSEGKGWLLACQRIISRAQSEDLESLSDAIDLVFCIFQSGVRWPEFARENCDSKSITNIAKILFTLSKETNDCYVRTLAIGSLSELVIRNSSTLRPLGSQLQSLALEFILDPLLETSQVATLLLTNLYRLSGKAEAPSNWSKTVKALIGTIDIILEAILSPFLETSSLNLSQHTSQPLAPLEILPQDLLFYNRREENVVAELPAHRTPLLLYRVNRLVTALGNMLTQSTDVAVSLPIGELGSFALRLLSIDKARAKDHPEVDWQSAYECASGSIALRSLGCQLVAQLANSTATSFTPFSSQTLLSLSSEIKRYLDFSTERCTDVSILYVTYAQVVSCCPPNPKTLQESMGTVLKAIIEDIRRLYGSEPSTSKAKNFINNKKTKKFDMDRTWDTLITLDSLDLTLANRALNTLETLISSAPYFFPQPHLTVVVRTLLKLAGHPSFTSPSPTPVGSSTTSSVLLSNSSFLTLSQAFSARPGLREKILQCLIKFLPIQRTSSHPSMGLSLAQNLTEIFSSILSCRIGCPRELSELAEGGLRTINLISRPRVPPVHLTPAQVNLEGCGAGSCGAENEFPLRDGEVEGSNGKGESKTSNEDNAQTNLTTVSALRMAQNLNHQSDLVALPKSGLIISSRNDLSGFSSTSRPLFSETFKFDRPVSTVTTSESADKDFGILKEMKSLDENGHIEEDTRKRKSSYYELMEYQDKPDVKRRNNGADESESDDEDEPIPQLDLEDDEEEEEDDSNDDNEAEKKDLTI